MRFPEQEEDHEDDTVVIGDDLTAWSQGGGVYDRETIQRLERLERGMEEVREQNRQASYERRQMMERQSPEGPWSREDHYKAVVVAGIGVGFIGLLASVSAGGFGFAPIFGVGLLFLIYAYTHGLPGPFDG